MLDQAAERGRLELGAGLVIKRMLLAHGRGLLLLAR
jgi:hypothetical protein